MHKKLLLFALSATASLYSETIVVLDLNGVVFTPKPYNALKYIGVYPLLKHALTEQESFSKFSKNMRKRLYSLMHEIKPHDNPDNQWMARDEEGNILPQIMLDSDSGKTKPCDALALITTFAHTHPNWFKNKNEQTALLRLAKVIFSPKIVKKILYLRPEAVDFVKKCKAQGIRVAILSNWGFPFFKAMKQEYPDFFDLFNPEDICISGKVGCSKPAPAIYAFFNTLSDKPENIWFIDDQEVNLIIPKEMGINTVHYKAKKWLGGLYTKFPPLPTIKKAVCSERENASVLMATQE